MGQVTKDAAGLKFRMVGDSGDVAAASCWRIVLIPNWGKGLPELMLLRDERRGGGEKGGLRELKDLDASRVKLSTERVVWRLEVRRLPVSGEPTSSGVDGLEASGLVNEFPDEASGKFSIDVPEGSSVVRIPFSGDSGAWDARGRRTRSPARRAQSC